jgi:hypothetical protein
MRKQLVWVIFAGLAILVSVSAADLAVAQKASRDQVAMLLIGSALIAVAAVVRRSA